MLWMNLEVRLVLVRWLYLAVGVQIPSKKFDLIIQIKNRLSIDAVILEGEKPKLLPFLIAEKLAGKYLK
tara:strand:- start:1683 stop:1889 length:207 start_codon:yes stop_codon:yes gene_type:complete